MCVCGGGGVGRVGVHDKKGTFTKMCTKSK